MKIGIDIRSTLKKNRAGIGRYTINLVNALAGVDRENEYLLYSRKKLVDFKRHLPRLPGENFSHSVDYFKKGPKKVMGDMDVFYTSAYDLRKPGNARFIISVHDVIHRAYPLGHDEKTIKEIDEKFKRVLGEADLLVASSYNTRSDLKRFYGVNEECVKVVYPGVDSLLTSRRGGLNLPYDDDQHRDLYILFVGTLEPRKNVDGLIRAFTWLKKESGLPHKLYIVGMKGWLYEPIFKAREESEFKKDIVFKGTLPEEALRKLYEGASVFVYPSFYEGFGLPIVEAFSCGVSVVTSKTSSCGEVGKDAALLIDPGDYKDMGLAILRLINDKALRDEKIKKGLERAREFNWEKTAREFLTIFSE
ncbi:MAG: glycosyltransferase family 4 protein [Candidatus Omnitrophica bacterium]|nr:glycosyltransferase family 4 protein [Candidatus Omnitrophota bacterium]